MEHQVKKRAVVIGGANMDICGASAVSFLLRDSNPGAVSVHPGGVGRNIAHDLTLLGMDVSLVTALGGDVFGSALRESCTALGMELSMTRVEPEMRSSTYLYITDDSGDMVAAVNDMGITECITPEYLAPLMERINGYDAVVLDANLPEAAIAFLAERCAAPMYADTVSAAKAARLLPALKRLRAVKPNRMEAEVLTGESDPERAAQKLLDAGVERVFISLGGAGLLAAERGKLIHLPAEHVEAVNCNGAGDAMTAAVVCGCTLGLSLEDTAALGLHAGAVTAASPETNAPGLRGIMNG